MSSRSFDDREHRRGLVLGLTLAEVLLLLLFLLLLALFWRLNSVNTELRNAKDQALSSKKDRDALEQALADLQPMLIELRTFGLSVESISALAQQLGELAALRREQAGSAEKSRLAEAFDELEPKLRESASVVVKDALRRGALLDPDDPPAMLRLAVEVVEIAGADESALQELKTVIGDAERAKPTDPVGSIKDAVGFYSTVSAALADASLGQLEASDVAALAIEALHAREGRGEHDWPPIINLSDADGYTFETGSAKLSEEFVTLLKGGVVERVEGMVKQYDVDVVEVIGHTDEQPIAQRPSNLDELLVGVFRGGIDVASLVPADNAGLGMSRAAAVAKILLADPRLANVRILPLSGAQVIGNGDRLTLGGTGSLRERRRIEIRVRRSSEWTPRPQQPADGSGR